MPFAHVTTERPPTLGNRNVFGLSVCPSVRPPKITVCVTSQERVVECLLDLYGMITVTHR